jgi:hypothetical protein
MSEAITELMSQIEDLSFAEMLKLNSLLAAHCAKQVKGKGTIAKAAKKEKKGKDEGETEAKPKRAAPTGLMAYQAFSKHCRQMYPDRFEGLKGMKAISAVVKEIKEADMDEYNRFVEKFKAQAASPAEEEAEESADAEAAEAAEETSAAAGGGGGAAAKPESIVKKEVEKLESKVQPAAAAAPPPAPAAAAAKPKKEVKRAVGGAKAKAKFETIVIQGEEYFVDPKTNKLFAKLEDGLSGSFVGTYQPDDEDEPIKYEDIM